MTPKRSRTLSRKLVDTDWQIQTLWCNVSKQCVSIASCIDTTPASDDPASGAANGGPGSCARQVSRRLYWSSGSPVDPINEDRRHPNS